MSEFASVLFLRNMYLPLRSGRLRMGLQKIGYKDGRCVSRSSSIHTSSTTSSIQNNNIIKSQYPDVAIPRESYFDFIWGNLDKHLHRTCLVNDSTGVSLTFKEVFDMSTAFGSALNSYLSEKNIQGIVRNRGDGEKEDPVLAILLPNHIEFPIVFGGAARSAITSTCINPHYKAREIAIQLKASNASAVVTTGNKVPLIKEAWELAWGSTTGVNKNGISWKDRILHTEQEAIHDGCLNMHELMTKEMCSTMTVSPSQMIDAANSTLTLPFSSGTTGTPKGVILTHENFTANISQCIYGPTHMSILEEATDDHQPSVICVLPLYHIYALNVTLGCFMRQGGKVILLPKFTPATFIESLKKHKPSALHLAPPLVSFLANHPDVKSEHLESVKHCVVAASSLGENLSKNFLKKAPHIIIREGWGMSELSPFGLLTPSNQVVLGSCGTALPNTEIKVVDVDTGKALGPNQKGELCCKGPQVMKGYLNNPQATAEALKDDGWLHSGDIAYYDSEGRIFIVDRLKELIKVKGFQVAPAELEDLLLRIEGVADAAVIGIPHERCGEVPRAFIVKKENAEVSESDVEAHVECNTVEYKHLKGGVEFVDVLPKSASGKLLRRQLRDSFCKMAK